MAFWAELTAALSLLTRANNRWEDAQRESVLLEDSTLLQSGFFSLLLKRTICRWGTGLLLELVLISLFFLAFAFGILAIILVAEPFAIVYNKILSFQHIKKLKKLIYIRFLAFSLFSNKLAFQLFKSQPNIIFCFPEVETKQHYPPISLFFLVSSFLRSFSSVVRKAVLR